MGTFEKKYAKFCRKPIPNDITFSDIEVIAAHFGCYIRTGGNHSQKVVYPPLGIVIPIPMHGKNIGEAYMKELKNLFDRIKEEKNDL